MAQQDRTQLALTSLAEAQTLYRERTEEVLNRIESNVEVITQEVGRQAELHTMIDRKLDRLADSIDSLTAQVAATSNSVQELSQTSARTIDRLVGLVEQLMNNQSR